MMPMYQPIIAFQAVQAIIEAAAVGFVGAVVAAYLSPGTAAILQGQEDPLISIAAYGFCGAQAGAAIAFIVLTGLPSTPRR